MKRLLVAVTVLLAVVLLVRSRSQRSVEGGAEVLANRIERSTLPATSKQAMRDLLTQGRLRPSQFDAAEVESAEHA